MEDEIKTKEIQIKEFDTQEAFDKAKEEYMDSFKMTPEQEEEMKSFENDENKTTFSDKIKLEWEEKFADSHALKIPEEKIEPDQDDEKNYKSFKTKDEFTKYIKRKTKKLEANNLELTNQNKQLQSEITDLRNSLAKKKFRIKYIKVNDSKPKQTKKGKGDMPQGVA